MQTESLIKLLSETLKFYAEKANYDNDHIKKDEGFQARHVLKIVSDNEATINSYEKLFEEFEKKTNEAITPDELVKMIGNLKNESYE
jgi:hypothetical protein